MIKRLRDRRSFRIRLLIGSLLLFALLAVAGTVVSQDADLIIEKASDPEAFTFKEVRSGTADAAAAGTRSNALKIRSAPVSSSGAMTQQITIDLPPGRLAMTPRLSIEYSSARAHTDSPVGAGWSLEPPVITRSSRRGFPPLQRVNGTLRYDDEITVFEGPDGPLVPTDDGPAEATGKFYAPLRENEPVRYEYLTRRRKKPPIGPPDSSVAIRRQHERSRLDPLRGLSPLPPGGLWVEHRPDGTRRYYGGDLDGRRGQITNELGTHAWLLMMEDDANGNHITYDYHNLVDQSRGDRSRPQRRPVLASVSWGGNYLTHISHLFKVTVNVATYGNSQLAMRNKGAVDLMAGNVLLDDRVTRISVGTAQEFGGSQQEYWHYDLRLTESQDTGRLLLARITRVAPNETDRVTTFRYSANHSYTWAPPVPLSPNLAGVYTQKTALGALQLQSLDDRLNPPFLRSAHQFLDYDGDGRTDVIYHPAGLRTTAARIDAKASYLQVAPGSWQSLEQPAPTFDYSAGPSNYWSSRVSTLTDLDGDYDADNLTFYHTVSARPLDGGGLSVVPPEVCGMDPEQAKSFWNRCGNIDPLPPDYLDKLRDTGATLVRPEELYTSDTPIIIAGLLKPTDRAIPTLLLVHPPQSMMAEAMAAPRLFESRFARDRPAGGRTPSRRRGPSPSPPNLQQGPDIRGAALKWGSAGLQGIDTLGGNCLQMVEACIEIMASTFVDPDSINISDEHLVLGSDMGPTSFEKQQFNDCSFATMALPIKITSNYAQPDPFPIHAWQYLEMWPAEVFPRTLYGYGKSPSGFTMYVTAVVNDILAPVTDINGDGRGDIILLKWLQTHDLQQPSYRFVPRAYLFDGERFHSDWSTGMEGVDFTNSLVDILHGGHFEECSEFQAKLIAGTAQRYYPHQINFNSLLTDVNADGLPDLVVAKPPAKQGTKRKIDNGHDVYLNRGYRWDKVVVPDADWTAPDSPFQHLRNRTQRAPAGSFIEESLLETLPIQSLAIVDINADGRSDVVLLSNKARRVFLNTGRGYRETTRYDFPKEFVLAVENPSILFGDPNTKYLDAGNLSDMGRLVDLDNDGLVDLLRPGDLGLAGTYQTPTWYRNVGIVPDLLTAIEASTGAWTEVSYVASSSPEAISIVSSNILPPRQIVVSKLRQSAGPKDQDVPPGKHRFATETIRLEYRDFVRDVAEAEVIGFTQVTEHFENEIVQADPGPAEDTPVHSVTVHTFYETSRSLPDVTVPFPLKGLSRRIVVDAGVDRQEVRSHYTATMLGSSVRIRKTGAHTAFAKTDGTSRWSGEDYLEFDPFGYPVVTIQGPSNGQVVSAADQAAVRWERSYLHLTRSRWITGLITEERAFGYRETINGPATKDAALSRLLKSYDQRGRAVAETNPGIITDSSATSLGLPVDRVVFFTYDDYGNTVRINDNGASPGSYDQRFVYGPHFLHRKSAETRVTPYRDMQPLDPITLTETFDVDLRTGQTKKRTDFNGKSWRSTYDSLGRLLTEEVPGELVRSITVYEDDYPRRVITRNYTGKTRYFLRVEHIDGQNRLLSAIEGAKGEQPIRRECYVLDAFGRPVASYQPAFVDVMDDVLPPATAPRTTTTYDGLDRPRFIRRPGNEVTVLRHGLNLEKEIRPKQNSVLRELDWRGNVVVESRLDKQGGTLAVTHYVRDGLGRIVRIIDADGLVRRFERDTLGRVVKAHLPQVNESEVSLFGFDYDLHDKLVRMTTPEDETVRIRRDELGRAVIYEATRGDGLSTIHRLEYDEAPANGMGRLWKTINDAGTWRVTYDALGHSLRLLYEPSAEVASGTDGLGKGLRAHFTYTLSGSLEEVALSRVTESNQSVPLGRYVYDLDRWGRSRRLTSAAIGSGTSDDLLLANATRLDPFDRITEMDLANGLTGRWDYDPSTARLSMIRYTVLEHNALAVRYAYDPNGNPVTENRYSGDAQVSSKEHRFDAMDRIAHTRFKSSTQDRTMKYAYSPAGNILAADGDSYVYGGPSGSAVTSIINSSGSSRSLAYDLAGRLREENRESAAEIIKKTVEYGPLGRAMQVATQVRNSYGDLTAGLTTRIWTDHLGRRVAIRTVDERSGQTRHIIDFAGFAEIRPEEGILIARIPVGGKAVVHEARSLVDGTRDTARSVVVHLDMRRSVLAASLLKPNADVSAPSDATSIASPGGTNGVKGDVGRALEEMQRALDGLGKPGTTPTKKAPATAPVVIKISEYDPWGASLSISSLPPPTHRFLGFDQDQGSGDYQFGPRLYDPTLRRFLSPDPLLWLDPERTLDNTQQLNLYSYAGNNPVRMVDPSGLKGKENEKDAEAKKKDHEASKFPRRKVKEVVNADKESGSRINTGHYGPLRWVGFAGTVRNGLLAIESLVADRDEAIFRLACTGVADRTAKAINDAKIKGVHAQPISRVRYRVAHTATLVTFTYQNSQGNTVTEDLVFDWHATLDVGNPIITSKSEWLAGNTLGQ